MADYGKAPIQITTQLGTKNLTLSAESAGDMLRLTADVSELADQIIENLTTVDQIILAKSVMATGVINPGDAGVVRPQTSLSQPPPSADGTPTAPVCLHGTKKFQESKPGAPKEWKAWFCPSPKGTPDQCQPEWIR